MGASRLPGIGTELGPCEGDCQHTDCIETKQMSKVKCRICGREIGFETSFYSEDSKNNQLVHAVCLEKEIEKRKK